MSRRGKLKAVFLDYATVSNGDVDPAPLADLPGIELDLNQVTAGAEIDGRLAGAGIVISNKVALDADCIRRADALELICLAATGTDNVDLDAAAGTGVGVCNIEGYCTRSVAQHVFAMILTLTQHLPAYQRLLADGAWRASPQFCMLDYPIRELDGKTLGIVGHGELGSAVARVGEAFGMRVALARRPGADDDRPGRVGLDELLAGADVVSLHCPLTDDTCGLIGRRELALMRRDALLINTARGALVDSAALADALRAGRIGGAGIDVLSQEPPEKGDPLLDDDIPRLILTPHIAWSAVEARRRAVDEIAANIRSYLDGGRRNRVV